MPEPILRNGSLPTEYPYLLGVRRQGEDPPKLAADSIADSIVGPAGHLGFQGPTDETRQQSAAWGRAIRKEAGTEQRPQDMKFLGARYEKTKPGEGARKVSLVNRHRGHNHRGVCCTGEQIGQR